MLRSFQDYLATKIAANALTPFQIPGNQKPQYWLCRMCPCFPNGPVYNPIKYATGCIPILWSLYEFLFLVAAFYQCAHILQPLPWRHNERDGVSNHRRLYCRLFRCRSKRKTSKLRVTGLCEGNSPVTGEFPTQRASNTEIVSIWWRHHGIVSPALEQTYDCPGAGEVIKLDLGKISQCQTIPKLRWSANRGRISRNVPFVLYITVYRNDKNV